MIFVTVGTHEQPFDRLIEYMDKLVEDGRVTEDVVMQTGYSTYVPQYCKWQKLLTYKEMTQRIAEARIVITHGGPSSFIAPLQMGKIPIVVPRKKEFHEHVNDHQVEFSKAIAERMGIIIVAEKIEELGGIIKEYNDIINTLKNDVTTNNAKFCNDFEIIVNEIMEGKL